ncbi:PilW family protein [Marinobacter sp.]|uniref:PilW family protein n=1 Tax=Marinobacter sp. TaxID=50741 RepID=UPI00384D03DD
MLDTTLGLNAMKGRKQKGLSLVELMIALALSSTLIFGLFTIYLDSTQTSRMSNSLARVQESGRIGFDIMARDMRAVGYQGCADPDDVTMNIIANNPPSSDFMENTLRGWEVTGANWANGTEYGGTSIETSARIGSDVIAIQRGVNTDIAVYDKMNAANANIKVSGGNINLFSKNDIVMISDCESADLFRISSEPTSGAWAHANNVNAGNFLSQAYNEKSSILRFTASVYYVADTNRDDAQGAPIYALYRASNNLALAGTTFQIDELVEGVESLQILYGELLPTNNIRYVPADEAGLDMKRVVAIRLGVLVSDSEKTRDNNDTASYDLPGETIVPAGAAGAVTHAEDQRLRRTFTTTVALRNRD